MKRVEFVTSGLQIYGEEDVETQEVPVLLARAIGRAPFYVGYRLFTKVVAVVSVPGGTSVTLSRRHEDGPKVVVGNLVTERYLRWLSEQPNLIADCKTHPEDAAGILFLARESRRRVFRCWCPGGPGVRRGYRIHLEEREGAFEFVTLEGRPDATVTDAPEGWVPTGHYEGSSQFRVFLYPTEVLGVRPEGYKSGIHGQVDVTFDGKHLPKDLMERLLVAATVPCPNRGLTHGPLKCPDCLGFDARRESHNWREHVAVDVRTGRVILYPGAEPITVDLGDGRSVLLGRPGPDSLFARVVLPDTGNNAG